MLGRHNYLDFTDENTEAQSGERAMALANRGVETLT